MNADNLAGLARRSEPIAGIYKHCDRWCRYCIRQEQCLAYEAENFPEGTAPIANEALVNHLSDGMEIAARLLGTYGEPCASDSSAETASVAEPVSCQDHPLFLSAGVYLDRANSVLQWLSASLKCFADRPGEELEAAIEIIRWYQYQIGAKLLRALHARHTPPAEEVVPEEDPNGSAKLSLIGMDRSIGAWGVLSGLHPEFQEELTEIIALLDALRKKTETEFPGARSFRRPGFDD
jgi:hypothetical protein